MNRLFAPGGRLDALAARHAKHLLVVVDVVIVVVGMLLHHAAGPAAERWARHLGVASLSEAAPNQVWDHLRLPPPLPPLKSMAAEDGEAQAGGGAGRPDAADIDCAPLPPPPPGAVPGKVGLAEELLRLAEVRCCPAVPHLLCNSRRC